MKKPIKRKKHDTNDNKIEVKVGTSFMNLIGIVKDAEGKEYKKD